MSRILSQIQKVSNRLTRLRLQPIQVFCLHHVCKQDDPVVICSGDWVSEESFIKSIQILRKRGYRFISLTEAWSRINKNYLRLKRYAVLSFDDGYRSSLPIYHWLEEQGIPYVLFLNSKYFDGVSVSPHIVHHAQSMNPTIQENEVVQGLYLTCDDLKELSPLFSQFASHGFEHVDAVSLQPKDFRDQVLNNIATLRKFPQFIPFHAYTWGRHSAETDQILKEHGITAVLMDGGVNYNSPLFIHRELFPQMG